jgi:hypothetical protein
MDLKSILILKKFEDKIQVWIQFWNARSSSSLVYSYMYRIFADSQEEKSQATVIEQKYLVKSQVEIYHHEVQASF